MPGIVLTVAQQKGGAGKTTLVAHLAVAFQQLGRRVATIDIDPQASLSLWHEARAAAGAADGLTHSRIAGWRTAGEAERLARSHDVVLLDSPPHAETEARIAVRAARLVLVPVQPSPMDVWATQPTLKMAASEKVPVLLILNRVPPRSRMVEELVAEIAGLGVAVAACRLGNRVGFASALMSGRSVTETGRRTRAAAEVRDLAAEILDRCNTPR